MRSHGTLVRWNDDRGFGFISPAGGRDEVFVQLSAFPRDGKRPTVGELLSYELDTDKDGRARAIRIMRPGQQRRALRPSHVSRRMTAARFAGSALVLLAIGAIGFHVFRDASANRSAPVAAVTSSADRATPSQFTCDGRTMCSQMTSCAEAQYFLRHCPATKLDGNGDGEPCEQQWCN
jgi:cold shock CspA family protein